MTLEFGVSVKLLDEHIEILKQELLFAMAKSKPESTTRMSQEIITIKKELDKAVHERMRLSRIHRRQTSIRNVVAVPAAASR